MAATSIGLEENIEGAFCYILFFVTGIIFYILEKDNKFVKFHAMQAILVFLPAWIIVILLGWIPVLGWIISGLIALLTLILWLILMLKAYQGEKFKLPIVGDIAEKNS
ncbi:MAG: DUF4870 domain-containing protein [Thermoplasmatales archaeon]|nr:MAG: DUF4870 domain-containing protein [Thermoplasmatales archaeon]